MFFVGAGISINSGLPNFLDFSKHILQCLTEADEPDRDFIAKRLRPEVLLQMAYNSAGEEIFKFYDGLQSDTPNLYHYYLAAVIHCGHYVFTPNVDTLIEQAYKELYPDETLAVIFETENGINDSNFDAKDKKLYKVHGTIEPDKPEDKPEKDKYASIRFLLNQVGKGVFTETRKTLENCVKECDCVFLGYSGADHFSNQPVLQQDDVDKPEDKTVKTAYWTAFNKEQPFEEILLKYWLVIKKPPEDDQLPMGEYESIKEFFTKRKSAVLYWGNTGDFIKDVVYKLNNNIDDFKKLELDKLISFAKKPLPKPAFLTRWRKYDGLVLLSRYWLRCGSLKKAVTLAEEALKLCLVFQNEIDVRQLLADIYIQFRDENKYELALSVLDDIIFRCQNHIQKQCDSKDMTFACNNIVTAIVKRANCLRLSRQKTKTPVAIELARTYITKYEEQCDPQIKTDSLSKLTRYEELHSLDGNISKLVTEVANIEKTLSETGDITTLATVLNTLGINYINSVKETTPQADKDKILKDAEECLNESKRYRHQLGDYYGLFQNYKNLGELWNKRGNSRKAIDFFEKAKKHLFSPDSLDEYRNDKLVLRYSIAECLLATLKVSQCPQQDLEEAALKDIEKICSAYLEDRDEQKYIRSLNVQFQLLYYGRKETNIKIATDIISFYRGKLDSDSKWLLSSRYHIDNPKVFLPEIHKILSTQNHTEFVANQINLIISELEKIKNGRDKPNN
ncbi:MAG: SIR2 family protein [Planctomycetaceae bacterium]|jgi:tetratricopeptide (TPR) repeat protein|nr:SIR2 family protein [Planctomycetaceae bacterium]